MLRREESRSDRGHQDEMHQRSSKDASCGRDQLHAQYSTSGGIVAFSATSARATWPGANTRGECPSPVEEAIGEGTVSLLYPARRQAVLLQVALMILLGAVERLRWL